MSNHLKRNRPAVEPKPVDHKQVALDEQAKGELYNANLHALLYIGTQLERFAEAMRPQEFAVKVADLEDRSGFDTLLAGRFATGGPVASAPAEDPDRYKTSRLMGGAR